VTALIEFGRNGWYGVISDEITFESISIVAQACADYLNDLPDAGPVVVGYDTRFLSREYAWAVQRVLTGNGLRVFLHKKPVPTSFLSLSVKLHDAALGIMVTGEGRPARYSGLSFRLKGGCPASRTWMNTLFNYLYRRYPRSSEDNRHLLQYIDVYRDYVNLVSKYIDFALIRDRKPFVSTDSFFGSVGTYAQELLRENGISGVHIRTKPNPGFLDCIPQPNERNMQPVSKLVLQKQGNLGLFFNSDGSHFGASANGGEILPGTWVSAVILDEWMQINGNSFDLYTEFFTPGIADLMLSSCNLEAQPLYRLHEENRKVDCAVIWDRQSLTFGPFLPDRDGLFQGLLLLQALCRHDMDWEALAARVEALAGERYMDQKSINMDSNVWEKKRSSVFEQNVELFTGEVTEITEYDKEWKLAFRDSSWLGFSYNEKESSLFLYYDTPNRESMDHFFPAVVNWLLQQQI
jgi:phosphomannomutase